MGHYYAIHTSIKLKPDTPKEIVEFFDLLYQVDVKLVADDHDLVLHSALIGLFPNSPIFKGQLELNRAIRYRSSYHDTYKYRGKWNDLYYSFSSSKENPVDEWLELLKSIFDYLDVKHGDIIYRWVWEDDPREGLLWVDMENRKIVQADGYNYGLDYEGTYLADDTHPWNQLGHEYPLVHYTNYFDLVNAVIVSEDLDRYPFLLEVNSDHISPV